MTQDRVLRAVLKADVSSFVGSMRVASKATHDLADDASKSAGKHKAAWESTGKGMMATGAVLAAGVGLAVKSFADFDAAMSQVKVGTNTSGAALKSLREAAIDAGAKTQYSATEAADAITAMGKAGVSTKDILGGGLTGALTLAAAGQLDVGQAAEIAATSMNQFGLAGKDLPHIADLLAAGAGKAMGSVQDLSGALKYAGVVAAGAGWSIEETTGVLAEFAQAGIIGEQAGTSLRGVIMSMSAPSQIAAKAMDKYNISMYDANGHFLKAAPLAQELQTRLGTLDEATRNAALGQIFGNEQITAANVLYKGGAAAVDQWTKSSNDAGYAARAAAELTNNWKGDIERLGGSLSSVLIKSGSGANGMLRTMTQELQGVVDLYGSAPVPIQQGATALGAVAAAALLAGGGMVTLLPKIAATKAALENMGRTGALMSSGMGKIGSTLMGPVGIALAVGVAGLGYYAHQAQETAARVDELAASLDQETGAITASTTAMVTKKLTDDGSLDDARKMNIAVGDLTNAYLGDAAARARVVAAAEAYSIAGGDAGDAMTNEATAAKKLTDGLGAGNSELEKATAKTKLNAQEQAAAIDPATGLTGAQKEAAEATKAAGDAAEAAKQPTKEQAQSEEDLAKAADAAKKAHDGLVDSITNFGNAMLTARGDARGYEAAVDAASDAVAKNGKTGTTWGYGLDITTEKGRDNAAALDGISAAALKAAQSNLELAEQNGTLSKTSKTVAGDVNTARTAFINTAVSMGMNKHAAALLADQSGLTAGRVQEITTKLIALGKQAPKPRIDLEAKAANDALSAIKKKITGLPNGQVKVSILGYAQSYQYLMALQGAMRGINNTRVRIATGPGGQGGTTLADGGYFRGAGTTTSDSNHAMLSDKEYVVKAAAVEKYGVDFFDQANAMRFSAGGYTGPRASSPAAPAAGNTTTFNAYGLDADKAVQRAMRQWEFQAIPR